MIMSREKITALDSYGWDDCPADGCGMTTFTVAPVSPPASLGAEDSAATMKFVTLVLQSSIIQCTVNVSWTLWVSWVVPEANCAATFKV